MAPLSSLSIRGSTRSTMDHCEPSGYVLTAAWGVSSAPPSDRGAKCSFKGAWAVLIMSGGCPSSGVRGSSEFSEGEDAVSAFFDDS